MGSKLRFTGLSSGLDTQSVVEALLTPYQSKIDKIKSKTTMANWKKDAYKEMSLKISNFRTKHVVNIANKSSLTKSKVEVSKEGALKFNNNQYLKEGVHTVEVKSLAKKAMVATSSLEGDIKADTLVKDISAVTGKIKLKDATDELTIDDTTKVSDIVDYINTNSNVECKFDEASKAFIINSKESGEKQTIDFTESDAAVLSALGIGKSTNGTYAFEGHDAEVIYNGSVTVKQSTNDFDINGLKFTAIAETTEAINVSVEKDIDSVVNSIKSFIDEYNSLIEDMSKKLYADSAKGYQPLTDEEKEAMSDKEVEAWEGKIKDSLFRNDSTLRNLYTSIRGAMTGSYKDKEGIKEEYNMLTQIGISSSNWTEKGKLTIDESKLREALAKDGEAVAKLMSTIADNINTQLTDASKSNDYRSYGQFFNDKILTSDISQYAKDLITAQEKYDKMESYYYKKFTAMEEAYNKMNSQSSLFSSL